MNITIKWSMEKTSEHNKKHWARIYAEKDKGMIASMHFYVIDRKVQRPWHFTLYREHKDNFTHTELIIMKNAKHMKAYMENYAYIVCKKTDKQIDDFLKRHNDNN